MSTTIQQIWSIRKEFLKYIIIGVSGFIFDLGSLALLKEYFGLSPVVAVLINQPFILAGIFYFNKRWSFRAGGLTHRQLIRFYMLAAFNYVIAAVWIYVLHDRLSINYLVARLFNIILAVTWNFLLYKYWVYKVEIPHDKA